MVYFICDNIYLLKIWSILSVKNIKLWRNIVFILRFICLSIHFVSNILYYISTRFFNNNINITKQNSTGLNIDNKENSANQLDSNSNIDYFSKVNYSTNYTNLNNKSYNNAYFYQSIGLLFDLIPSIRESILYRYFRKLEIFPYISDGWVAIGGTISSVFEIYSLYEYLSIDGISDYIINNS